MPNTLSDRKAFKKKHSIVFITDGCEIFDIFKIPELGLRPLFTQRFVDFVKDNGLTNFHFVHAEDC